MSQQIQPNMPRREHEPEHEGPLWKHPYFLYIIITAVLFVTVTLVGWLAWTQGWIPNRGFNPPR